MPLTPQITLIEVNRVAGLKPEDVLAKPLEECYWWAWSPEAQQRLIAAIETAASGTGSRYDEVVRVGGGKFRTIDFKIAPVLVPSAIDITGRKETEKALRKAKAELESRVLENTSEIAKQKELLQKIVGNIPAQSVMGTFYAFIETLADLKLFFKTWASDVSLVTSNEQVERSSIWGRLKNTIDTTGWVWQGLLKKKKSHQLKYVRKPFPVLKKSIPS